MVPNSQMSSNAMSQFFLCLQIDSPFLQSFVVPYNFAYHISAFVLLELRDYFICPYSGEENNVLFISIVSMAYTQWPLTQAGSVIPMFHFL